MKAIITILFTVFLIGLGFSQINDRLSLSAYFQKDTYFRKSESSTSKNYSDKPVNDNERSHFTSGIAVNYGFSNNLEVSTGAQYSRQLQNYFAVGSLICNPEHGQEFYYNTKNEHIEFPLQMRFYMLPGKLKIHANLGQIFGKRVNLGNGNHPWTISAIGGIGLNYFINRFQFSLSGIYKRLLLSNREHFHFYTKNSLGIAFKTTFALNK